MNKLLYDKLSVVVPAYNEGKTLVGVIKEISKLKEIAEIILVNDGSTDDTEKKIMPFRNDKRFIYIKFLRNRGKGEALKAGIERARNEVVLLIDADLRNITAVKIKKIYMPVLKDEVDVARGAFRRKRGRVTEYAVKPMMKILFPDMYFEQPISGQICAKKSFLTNVNLESKYGVDIGLLFDAIELGQRIIEVDIGRLEHKANDDETIAEMSRQVLETMIKRAGLIQHKYKLIIFTLDNTLVQKFQIQQIVKKLNLNKLDELKLSLNENKISFKDFIKRAAPLFKDLKMKQMEEMVENLEFVKYAPEVISALKRRKYQVAILSSNFSPIVIPIAKKLGIDLIECVYLENINGKFTGKITERSCERWATSDLEDSFEKAFLRLTQKAKVKPLETIMVANSPKCIPLFLRAGLAIALRPEDPVLKEIADKTISILPEVLAIME